MPNFGLIIIGDEIMSGKRADKHLHAVIERLRTRGLQLAYAAVSGRRQTTIPANAQRGPSGSSWCCIRRRAP
jgi:molybdopterin-biosynthesis enzyme MoeA-like protein